MAASGWSKSARNVFIAPWLRGYAPSPLLGPFDMENLVADILALIDSLEAQQVDLLLIRAAHRAAVGLADDSDHRYMVEFGVI